MQNQSLNSNSSKENIDLGSIIKLLMNSKKLVLVVTLVTPILVFLFNSQQQDTYESTAIVEIGQYLDFKKEKVLIEPSINLYNELNINFIYKNGYTLSVAPFENRLVEIKASSNSYSESVRIVEEAIVFVRNRHSKIISDQIVSINDEINMHITDLTNQLFQQNKNIRKQITYELTDLTNQLRYIDSKIKQLNEIISKDTNNLALLSSSPELLKQRTAVSPTLDQLIYTYKNEIVELENRKTNLLLKIDNLKGALSSSNLVSENILELRQEKVDLQTQLEILNNKIKYVLHRNDKTQQFAEFNQTTEIKKLTKTNALVKQLKELSGPNLIETQQIGEIITTQIQINKILTAIISLIFGFVASTFIILIRSSIVSKKN